MNDLLNKLEEIYKRWLQIGEDITQPDIMSDMKRYIKLNKDYKDLQPVVEAYKRYKNVIGNIANAKDVLANEKDDEFRAMAKEELDQLSEEKEKLEEEVKLLRAKTKSYEAAETNKELYEEAIRAFTRYSGETYDQDL